MDVRTRALVALQWLMPQRLLSRIVGWLARREAGMASHVAIRAFIRVYGVDMHEAAAPQPQAYVSFNAFFTRALRADARPLPADPALFVSPADGVISQLGNISDDTLLQAKGHDYRLPDLFDGDTALAALFTHGAFATIYLAPRNYHRVHMPWAGSARYLRHVPGSLFAVNAATARALPRLFCRNERMLAVFADGLHWFALIMVGAMNVSAIELVLPPVRPARNRPASTLPPHTTHTLAGPTLARGAEFGRFNMGSTVIVIASRGLVAWDAARGAEQPIRLGAALGRVSDPR